MKKEEKQPVYVLCPRCELNYINKKDKLCTVCKAELGLIDKDVLLPDEEEIGVEKLCPICHVNYIGEDEEICFLCQKERDEKGENKDDEWDYDAEADADVVDDDVDDLDGMMLTDEDEMSEEDDELDYSDPYKEPDDYNYNVNEEDFLGDDDDEDDEEDGDDDDDDE